MVIDVDYDSVASHADVTKDQNESAVGPGEGEMTFNNKAAKQALNEA